VGSLSLRPGDSLTIPKMALSVGFIRFVSSTDTTQAKGLLASTPVGLSPTEHVSFHWTHSLAKISSVPKMTPRRFATRQEANPSATEIVLGSGHSIGEEPVCAHVACI